MKNTTLIYGLVSTRDMLNVRYVGKTITSLRHKLSQHKSESKIHDNYKDRWIRKEFLQGYNIKIIQIDEVDNFCWQFWEIYWIAEYRRQGYKLVNTSLGGDSIGESSCRSIIALNKYGKYIKKFDSIAQTGRELIINIKQIEKCLCKTSNRKSAHGYQFFYKEDYDSKLNYNIIPKSKVKKKLSKEDFNEQQRIKALKAAEKNKKPIQQLTIDGVLVSNHKSVRDASRDLEINYKGIYKVISGERKIYKGYIWKHI